MNDINTFYFIGFGSIARSLIEIWQLENLYLKHKIVIIEPLDIPQWCFDKHKKMKHIKKAITKKNHRGLLKKINSKCMVIDLSVNVDCLMIIDQCILKGSMYVNTSLENWANYNKKKKINTTNYEDIKDDTLYERKMILDEKYSKSTILSDMGFNPGFVSVMVLCAIDLMTKGIDRPKNDPSYYAKYCKDNKVTSIQIVELDTQKTKLKANENMFYNTWSCLGWISEASQDNVMMGYNPYDPDFEDDEYRGLKLIHPDRGEKNVVFLPIRGCDITRESITLNLEGEPERYRGYLIPHGEANTLSSFLTSKSDDIGKEEDYRPSVYYVYSPSQACIDSTNILRDNKYKPPQNWKVLELGEITEGYDSIGTLFNFEDGRQIIFCSVVDTEFVKSLGFKYCQSTGLQVSASLNASIKYMLRNKKDGVIDPEDLNHPYIFKEAEKYLGKIYFKQIITE